MRFYRKATITLSEDDSTAPKEIRFNDVDRETINKLSILEGGSNTHVLEAGDSFTLPMGQISLGKYFYLYSTGAFTLSINGGSALSMAASVVSEMWADFTTLTVTNPTESSIRITWAIGGA